MELSVELLPDGIKLVKLSGRMDIAGTDQVSVRLAAETSTEKAFVILDLRGVEFLASVGIGTLVRSAKALRLRGGEAVILSNVPVVTLVLEKTRIFEVVRICEDMESARGALAASMHAS
ncbi:MAG TPA: STAS domain-containing protein [Bacteroidota bacterium]|nr:STAS domain-containing protein [Bacteroidota bacterium]